MISASFSQPLASWFSELGHFLPKHIFRTEVVEKGHIFQDKNLVQEIILKEKEMPGTLASKNCR